MKLRTIIHTLLIAAISLPISADDSDTATQLLQVKGKRVYFDVGSSEDILPLARFEIFNTDSVICSGQIERVFPGLSVGLTDQECQLPQPFESLTVKIESALIDIETKIVIGTNVQTTILDIWLEKIIDSDSTQKSPKTDIRKFNSSERLWDEYESGNVDVVITYKSYSQDRAGHTMIAPAPFIAALIPNISSEINNSAMLTTSIYYRFDSNRLSLFFDGDSVKAITNLFNNKETSRRPFPYDPLKGSSLFKRIKSRPRKLEIYLSSPELKMMADYLSDLLSRDRCRARTVSNRSKADLYLELMPYDDNNDSTMLNYLVSLLRNDKPNNGSMFESVGSLEQYINWYHESFDQSRREYYSNLIERIVRDDIGLFPLFRPHLFITTGERIRGIELTENEGININSLRRLVLPSEQEESIK